MTDFTPEELKRLAEIAGQKVFYNNYDKACLFPVVAVTTICNQQETKPWQPHVDLNQSMAVWEGLKRRHDIFMDITTACPHGDYNVCIYGISNKAYSELTSLPVAICEAVSLWDKEQS